MIGRRVDSLDELERPGDYVPFWGQDHRISCLWFIMPGGTQGRIAGKGHGVAQTFGGLPEPEWEITEEADGTVTVEPSIDYPGHWHGHLRHGEWAPA